jgi:hypothetical protein
MDNPIRPWRSGREAVPLDKVLMVCRFELLTIDGAGQRLAFIDPTQGNFVELMFFRGLHGMERRAEVLGHIAIHS